MTSPTVAHAWLKLSDLCLANIDHLYFVLILRVTCVSYSASAVGRKDVGVMRSKYATDFYMVS